MASPDIAQMIFYLCERLGQNPKLVEEIVISSDTVKFTLYRADASGDKIDGHRIVESFRWR